MENTMGRLNTLDFGDAGAASPTVLSSVRIGTVCIVANIPFLAQPRAECDLYIMLTVLSYFGEATVPICRKSWKEREERDAPCQRNPT
jgi:hypothetical protein